MWSKPRNWVLQIEKCKLQIVGACPEKNDWQDPLPLKTLFPGIPQIIFFFS